MIERDPDHEAQNTPTSGIHSWLDIRHSHDSSDDMLRIILASSTDHIDWSIQYLDSDDWIRLLLSSVKSFLSEHGFTFHHDALGQGISSYMIHDPSVRHIVLSSRLTSIEALYNILHCFAHIALGHLSPHDLGVICETDERSGLTIEALRYEVHADEWMLTIIKLILTNERQLTYSDMRSICLAAHRAGINLSHLSSYLRHARRLGEQISSELITSFEAHVENLRQTSFSAADLLNDQDNVRFLPSLPCAPFFYRHIGVIASAFIVLFLSIIGLDAAESISSRLDLNASAGAVILSSGDLVALKDSSRVVLRRADNGAVHQKLILSDGARYPVVNLCYARSDNSVAASYRDRVVRYWDPEAAIVRRSVDDPGLDDDTLLFGRDCNKAADILDQRRVKVWTVGSPNASVSCKASGARVTAVAALPDSDGVIWGSDDGKVRSCAGDGVAERFSLDTGCEAVESIATSADNRWIAVGCRDNWIRIMDVANREPIGAILSPGSELVSLVFSSDGQALLAVTTDGMVRLWTVGDGGRLGLWRVFDSRAKSAAFSLDSKWVVLNPGRDGASVRPVRPGWWWSVLTYVRSLGRWSTDHMAVGALTLGVGILVVALLGAYLGGATVRSWRGRTNRSTGNAPA